MTRLFSSISVETTLASSISNVATSMTVAAIWPLLVIAEHEVFSHPARNNVTARLRRQ